jgi:hypothetical protein
MIKKFKNGNLLLKSPYKLPKNSIDSSLYCNNIDAYYNNEMFFADLNLNQINGYMYITDFNKELAYDLHCHGYYYQCNILIWLDDKLKNEGNLKLYALSKKKSRSLLQDLENGY